MSIEKETTAEVVILSTEQARVHLIESLRDVRRDAKAIESRDEAVEHAIQATLVAAEIAITSTGAETPVLHSLSEQLTASWAAEVNS